MQTDTHAKAVDKLTEALEPISSCNALLAFESANTDNWQSILFTHFL